MSRQAEVWMHQKRAGLLVEDENGYRFTYDPAYLDDPANPAVSLTLPLTEEAAVSPVLFSFFDGLIPEGWLLDVVQHTWKLDPRDRMGLLMACCKDCIGAVSIHPLVQEDLA